MGTPDGDLAVAIVRWLNAGIPGRCLLLEESWGQWSKPSSLMSNPRHHCGEVTYWAHGPGTSVDDVEASLRRHSDYPGLGILGEHLDLSDQRPDVELSVGTIQGAVENASALLVRAFDGEGYLLWVAP